MQPPSSKHLTDEELKQQYGIHMTSRIQENEGEKEAKWADIEDDEDDWAPETLQWTDGTKVTLAHSDHGHSSSVTEEQSEKKQPPTPPETPDISDSSKDLPPRISSSVGPRATVLKLRSGTEKPSKPTLTSKGQVEKEGSPSKSPAPQPKSPWAPLPPVEKVSPALSTPPAHSQPPAQPSRFSAREHPAPEAHAPTPKEIAADDFNRFWRDNHSNGPRELYNSQSGKYELVTDIHTRRGVGRNDHHFRPSSLLQRGAYHESATSTPDFTHWNRRGTDSKVSDGSSNLERRIPFNDHVKQNDMLAQRPVSPIDESDGGSSFPQPPMAPSDLGGFSHNLTYAFLPTADDKSSKPEIPVEDPIAMQQRIMREKRDLARRRRQQEEEKEETARKERIQLKLASLGPPTSSKISQQQGHPAPEMSGSSVPPTAAHSPPRPPVLEPSGEPKQYGVMKIHPPETVTIPAHERARDKSHVSTNQNQQILSPRDSKAKPPKSAAPAPLNGLRLTGTVAETWKDSSLEESWPGTIPINQYPPWADQSMNSRPAPASSLWGPPAADKILGGNMFDRNFTGFSPPRSHLSLSEPLPIGQNMLNDKLANQERLLSLVHGPSLAENGLPSSPLPAPERKMPDNLQPIGHPGPIGPPSSQMPRWQVDHTSQFPKESYWSNFPIPPTASVEESGIRREFSAISQDEIRPTAASSMSTTFPGGWNRTAVEQTNQRAVIGGTKAAVEQPSISPLLGSSVADIPFAENPRSFASNATKESRFFPHGNEAAKKPSNPPVARARSPSPPPPEDFSSHPVFTGDSTRPLVHLPTPKPRVKLPPRNSVSVPAPPQPPPPPPPPKTFASMVATPPIRAPSKPITSTTFWQDRFNGLFGKKTSASNTALATKKITTIPIASATKEPLEVSSGPASASVSLPHQDSQVPDEAGKVASKAVEAEEAIFEDREAGSLPIVKVPDMAPQAAWAPAPRPGLSNYRPIQSQSIEPFVFTYLDNGQTSVVVHLPGRNGSIVHLPKKGGNHMNNLPRHRGPSGYRNRRGRVKVAYDSSRNSSRTGFSGPRPNGNYTSRVSASASSS